MGGEYTTAFAQLFAPARGRVEWCREPHCDDTGFSVGFSGVESGLFFGAYRGDTNSVRALAHEAGHAVHRQFMNQNQPIAPYNLGPHFVFESFAIFNELLLLEHLYRTAEAPAAKAYYLHQWLDDVVFQIYGSAEETDLEQSIYAGVAKGDMRNAKDLDALTKTVLARYEPAVALAPEMNLAWARNRLYFTDPLYDVNYLFAGLLAVQYVTQFEAQPKDFSHRYVALLKNGFDDTPQALERRFLGIGLDNSTLLVDAAAALIEKRTIELQTLYKAAALKPNVAH
jgi:oligoendopeptidase F